MIEMEVSGVYTNSDSTYPQVVLREKGGDARLHIVICFFEALAIYMAHNQQKPVRPISYDLAHTILDAVEAHVIRVEITDLHQDTFYAEVHLESDAGAAIAIDSRPSDAIALALRTGSPIYAARTVIDHANRAPSADSVWLAAEEEAPQPAHRAVGSEPAMETAAGSADGEAASLKKRLDQAVAEEAYEEAARLRDKIFRLERGEDD